ncbi:UNVERIFIED_CONTAM: hypothetical protein Sradi_2485700 [Sesamum radiatum]|uniref:Uncharacterized protein n=1 Tax=Sesamum radiatum TaxID=300843 RepID=A0AAW2SKL0_SESRA
MRRRSRRLAPGPGFRTSASPQMEHSSSPGSPKHHPPALVCPGLRWRISWVDVIKNWSLPEMVKQRPPRSGSVHSS